MLRAIQAAGSRRALDSDRSRARTCIRASDHRRGRGPTGPGWTWRQTGALISRPKTSRAAGCNRSARSASARSAPRKPPASVSSAAASPAGSTPAAKVRSRLDCVETLGGGGPRSAQAPSPENACPSPMMSVRDNSARRRSGSKSSPASTTRRAVSDRSRISPIKPIISGPDGLGQAECRPWPGRGRKR